MMRELSGLLVAVFLLGGCALEKDITSSSFDLPSTIRARIEAVAADAARNKTRLSVFCEKIRDELGTIYDLERYTTNSIFSKEQEQFSKLVHASGLRENETFVVIQLDGDQACYVICDEDDIVVRSAMHGSL